MSKKSKPGKAPKPGVTPMIKQYLNIKRSYQDAILMYRMGDFYEMFFDDAKIASKELDIVLTTRGRDKGQPIPLAGVPYHALNSYLTRLIKKGFKVAICEQIEDPKKAKGIVARDVVRVVTPGTSLEENILDEKSGSYLLSLFYTDLTDEIGIAYIDISTGDFRITTVKADNNYNTFMSELNRISPKEILVPEEFFNQYKAGELPFLTQIEEYFGTFISSAEDWTYEFNNAEFEIKRLFNVSTLDGFGVSDIPLGICAAGGLLKYIESTQKQVLKHIKKLSRYNLSEYMFIDIYTQTNLELTKTISDGRKKNSLIWVLDYTKTPMGGRLLKEWIERPLIDLLQIRRRHYAVNELIENSINLKRLQETLNVIVDIERIIGRLSANLALPRDMLALKISLNQVPEIIDLLKDFKGEYFEESKNLILKHTPEIKEIVSKIDEAIIDAPPNNLRDGGIFKDGYSGELDELRLISKSGRQFVKELETRERERTGISKLRVSFNRVFGYFIEVSRAHSEKVPEDYIRKQTLVNTERFFTTELKEFEEKILGAQEKINELENILFIKLR